MRINTQQELCLPPSSCFLDGNKSDNNPDDTEFYRPRRGEGSRQFAERMFRQADSAKVADSAKIAREFPNSVQSTANSCCRQLYCKKIVELIGMEDLWRDRQPPKPLDLDALLDPAGCDNCRVVGKDSGFGAPPDSRSACRTLGFNDDHAVWDVHQSAAYS